MIAETPQAQQTHPAQQSSRAEPICFQHASADNGRHARAASEPSMSGQGGNESAPTSQQAPASPDATQLTDYQTGPCIPYAIGPINYQESYEALITFLQTQSAFNTTALQQRKILRTGYVGLGCS